MYKNFLVRISYDGKEYYGFQIQPGYKTIEKEIIDALSIILKSNVKIFGSGRTDRGVHARRQYFNFYTDLPLKSQDIKRALNGLLPQNIRVDKVKSVEDNFHARYSAVSKEYHYLINYKIDPFTINYVLQLKQKLDYTLLEDGLKLLQGVHDFSNFTANTLEEKSNLVRTIILAQVKRTKSGIKFIFKGDGFLKYQVRMMVGALIHLGFKKITLQQLSDYINLKTDKKYPYKAPSCGLYLMEVNYG